MRDLLRSFKPWIDDWHRDHPDTVLDTRWKHSDLGKETLICGTSHDLMRVSLRSAIGADNDDCRAQILDKMPSCASDSKDIDIVTNVSQNLQGGVMLEQEVHFYADASNVLKHVRKLHILWV